MAEPKRIDEIIGDLKADVFPENEEIQEAGSLKRRGGARPGAGRPKGSISKVRRTAKEAKERFIERVQDNVDTLFNAQLSLAKGEQHLFVKYHVGEGKERRAYVDIVTDPETIAEYLNDYGETLNQQSDDEYYYISTRPANNQAIDSMLNRAFGKAPEKIEIEGGFFKANSLKIEVVQPQYIDAKEAEVVDGTNTDTDRNTDTETEQETATSP